MQVKTIAATTLDEFAERIRQHASGHTLAIVFAAIGQDYDAIRLILTQAGLAVFGASTAGEIVDGETLDECIVAALVDLPRSCFMVRAFPSPDADMLSLGRAIGDWADSTFADPCILLHQSGPLLDGEELLNGTRQGLGREAPIYGGRAGNSGDMLRTWCFDGNQVLDRGASVLVLDRSRVQVSSAAAAGWTAIGTAKKVTRATGNLVQELDGRPALETIASYLPVDRDIYQVSPKHPFHITRPDGSAILRSPVMWRPEDGAVLFAGTVPEGSLCSFTVAAGQCIMDATLSEADGLREQVPQADLVILYSCLGRLQALGPLIEDEVSGICALWDAPSVGFFTLGEFGCREFHNNTCMVLTLSGPSAQEPRSGE